MANQNVSVFLGFTALALLVSRLDSETRDAAARNRRLALFRNDICYINRYSSASPVFFDAPACRVASDQGQSMAFQQFEQALQLDATLKARAEQELQLTTRPRQDQVISDLRYLNRINQRDNPEQPQAGGKDGW